MGTGVYVDKGLTTFSDGDEHFCDTRNFDAETDAVAIFNVVQVTDFSHRGLFPVFLGFQPNRYQVPFLPSALGEGLALFLLAIFQGLFTMR